MSSETRKYQKVGLDYFADTGKHYASGAYMAPLERPLHKIIADVDTMQFEGRLPGLTAGVGKGYYVVVTVGAVKQLLKPFVPGKRE